MEEEEEPENPKGMSKADIHGRKTYEDFTTRRVQAGAIIYRSCSPEVKNISTRLRILWGCGKY